MVAAIIILLLILFNGLFAMAEIAIITSRKSRLQQMAAKGNQGAATALKLAQIPDKFFSTIQVGITLIGILAGAVGEATLAQQFGHILEPLPIIGRYHETLSFILIVGIITYLSVVIGELVPKRLAISNPEGIASLVAPLMNALLKVTLPIVRALSSSSELVFKVFGIKQTPSATITDEEIKVLMGEGTRAGVFSGVEKKLVDRVLHLDDMQINSLMTPRAKIQCFDINKLAKDLPKYLGKYKHSRIIICDKTLDNLMGVIHVKDFLRFYLTNPKVDIKDHLEKPHLLTENTQVLKVLELFRKSPMHMALIIDEHGSVQGLVTFNDVLEAIVGDIETRSWTEKLKIVKRPDNSYLVDGMLTIKELKDALKIEKLPKQAQGHVTLGGFIMTYLDKVPQEGDKFDWDGYRFEVVDMDKNRVDKVLITLIPEGVT